MIIVGQCKSTDPNMGYPLALAKSLSLARGDNIGEEIGNYIYYTCSNGSEYCAEITDKKGNELQLVACGWVKRKSCRLTP